MHWLHGRLRGFQIHITIQVLYSVDSMDHTKIQVAVTHRPSKTFFMVSPINIWTREFIMKSHKGNYCNVKLYFNPLPHNAAFRRSKDI